MHPLGITFKSRRKLWLTKTKKIRAVSRANRRLRAVRETVVNRLAVAKATAGRRAVSRLRVGKATAGSKAVSRPAAAKAALNN